MEKITNKKSCYIGVASALVIVFAYAFENILELFIAPNKTAGILLAMLYTVLLACITLALMKSDEPFSGLVAALIGFKMMPVPIDFLWSVSKDASMLYYLVQKAAVVIFALLAYRFYKIQSEPRGIKALPILTIMMAIPFTNTISSALTGFFLDKTGSMLLGYFSQFALYALATLVILGVAYVSSVESMRFAFYYELAALGINFLRKAGWVVVLATGKNHISKSYFVWLALYVVLAVCAAVAYNIKKKKTE